MNVIAIELAKHLEGISAEIIDKLLSIGAMKESTAIKFIAKAEYWEMLKKSDISCRDAVIQISIKWKISESTVHNVLYKSPQIKV